MRTGDICDVLKLICRRGPISRVEIAQQTRFAQSYVGAIVREAQNRGFVVERGFAPSGGGRRRVLFELNPCLAQLVGIDMGTANLRLVVADFAGKVLSHRCLPSEASKGKDHLLRLVHVELKRALQQYPEIAAIGISHSGVIDHQAGKVLFWPKVSGWNDVPLKGILEEAYGLPTLIEDSVRSMAKAEQTFGLGKDLPQFVFVTIGMGIGCAIFFDGHLYEGADGLAGEFGHMTVEENGNLCTCGNRGCLELYSSASAIVGRVRAELGHGVGSSLGSEFGDHLDELTVEKIVAAAQAHDRLAERVITEAGMHLGTALAGIVNLLNPRKIILGGRVPQAASELFLSPLLYNLRHRALPQAVEKLEISVSQLGEESAALGAVLMTREIVLAARCREVSGSISMTNGVRPPEEEAERDTAPPISSKTGTA